MQMLQHSGTPGSTQTQKRSKKSKLLTTPSPHGSPTQEIHRATLVWCDRVSQDPDSPSQKEIAYHLGQEHGKDKSTYVQRLWTGESSILLPDVPIWLDLYGEEFLTLLRSTLTRIGCSLIKNPAAVKPYDIAGLNGLYRDFEHIERVLAQAENALIAVQGAPEPTPEQFEEAKNACKEVAGIVLTWLHVIEGDEKRQQEKEDEKGEEQK